MKVPTVDRPTDREVKSSPFPGRAILSLWDEKRGILRWTVFFLFFVLSFQRTWRLILRVIITFSPELVKAITRFLKNVTCRRALCRIRHYCWCFQDMITAHGATSGARGTTVASILRRRLSLENTVALLWCMRRRWRCRYQHLRNRCRQAVIFLFFRFGSRILQIFQVRIRRGFYRRFWALSLFRLFNNVSDLELNTRRIISIIDQILLYFI